MPTISVSQRPSRGSQQMKRQDDGLPPPFPGPVTPTTTARREPIDDDEDEPIPTRNARTTLDEAPSAPTTQRQVMTPLIPSAVTSSSTGTSRLGETTSNVPSTVPTPTRATASPSISAPLTPTSTVEAEPSRSLIFLTTFPADFPVPTLTKVAVGGPGRGYVFIDHSEIADSMLVFATFCAAFFAFTIILIRSSRILEERRGVSREDAMVRDDMRWAEGREVVEKRIVYESSGGVGGGVGGGRSAGRAAGGVGRSKLAKRQSWD